MTGRTDGPINGSEQFQSPIAFRKSLEDRLKRAAKDEGRPLEQLRRQFLFHRFLALVFAPGEESRWVLKGGAGLLMRIPGARFSRDLDLLHLEVDTDAAIGDLRARVAPRPGDHLTFVIDDTVQPSPTNPVVGLRVTAYTGATLYGRFPIDLATDLHLVTAPEVVVPSPVVEVPGLAPTPAIVVYPIADQVADKVCAMFETHGPDDRASTRYRDLYDLALIVTTQALDATQLQTALGAESSRRGLQLPAALKSPGASWPAGYEALARDSSLPRELRSFGAALEMVGRCVTPLLSGDRTTGRWVPRDGWQ